MRIYDISQEVFGCKVFPGDPSPQRNVLMSISEGEVCNLTEFTMCAHNGTHVDAPYHFYDDGKKIDEVALDKFVGYAYVVEHEGNISADDAVRMLEKAKDCNAEASKRLLVKGNATVTTEAAKVFADAGIKLFGNESQTVGPEDAPKVLLEGIRLSKVPEGDYLLSAAPLNLGGADGSPCRAVLTSLE